MFTYDEWLEYCILRFLLWHGDHYVFGDCITSVIETQSNEVPQREICIINQNEEIIIEFQWESYVSTDEEF